MNYKTRYWNENGEIEVDTKKLPFNLLPSKECTETNFLNSIKDHKMEIIRIDGVNRHIRFKKEDSLTYYFDLITWPGHLCITGDVDTYVFKRLHDMFDFFKTDSKEMPSDTLGIDLQYWAQKLVAKGYKEYEFSTYFFIETIVEIFGDYEFESKEQAQDCFQKLADGLIELAIYGNCSNEGLRQAAMNFCHTSGFSLKSYFEDNDTYQYTYRYIWCCYAIAWGIKQFDELIKIG